MLRKDYETDRGSTNSGPLFRPMYLLYFAGSAAMILAIITVRKFHNLQVRGWQKDQIPHRPLHRLLNNQFD